MAARLLLWIKHRAPWLWVLVDAVNGLLYRLLHARRMRGIAEQVCADAEFAGFRARLLAHSDLADLEALLARQGSVRLKHFKPHDFDGEALLRAWRNPAFLMFGVFETVDDPATPPVLVGYFYLRGFWNRRCFGGRLIDKDYEGRGIGSLMNQVMYETAWQSGFRCLSTISKNNARIMRAHAQNPALVVLDELPGEMLFVEFLRPARETDKEKV
ncbi:MAG: hypothetical protein LAT56_11860 [Wenzhouxiangella sp.]|nr:hypothetical protein [Wenzhouxiangella sp.]